MTGQFINMTDKQSLAITDIKDTDKPGVVCVILKDTGKPCNINRKYVEFLPGHIIIPNWLADRIRGEMTSDNFYLNQFLSDECQCGRSKRPRHSFCFKCYKQLPDDMQKALWRRFHCGYEEAYEEAVKYLTT